MIPEEDALSIARRSLDAWAAAFALQDPEAMVARYADRCLHFGGRARLYVGSEGVREYFGTLAPRRSRSVSFDDVKAERLGDSVVHLAAVARFVMDSPIAPMRLTQTLVREAGDWKVASHHASAMPAS